MGIKRFYIEPVSGKIVYGASKAVTEHRERSNWIIYVCQLCKRAFKDVTQLTTHQNLVGHFVNEESGESVSTASFFLAKRSPENLPPLLKSCPIKDEELPKAFSADTGLVQEPSKSLNASVAETVAEHAVPKAEVVVCNRHMQPPLQSQNISFDCKRDKVHLPVHQSKVIRVEPNERPSHRRQSYNENLESTIDELQLPVHSEVVDIELKRPKQQPVKFANEGFELAKRRHHLPASQAGVFHRGLIKSISQIEKITFGTQSSEVDIWPTKLTPRVENLHVEKVPVPESKIADTGSVQPIQSQNKQVKEIFECVPVSSNPEVVDNELDSPPVPPNSTILNRIEEASPLETPLDSYRMRLRRSMSIPELKDQRLKPPSQSSSSTKISNDLTPKILNGVHFCELCKINLSSQKKLISHNESYHKPSLAKWICTICNKDLRTKFLLGKHKDIHTVGKNYMCPHCSKTYTRKDRLLKHCQKNHVKGRFICPSCKRCQRTKHALEIHQDSCVKGKSSMPGRIKCPICGSSFQLLKGLMTHLKNSHV